MPIAKRPAAEDPPFPFVLMAAAACALFAWLTPTHELPWAAFHAEMAMALAGLIGAGWVLWRSRYRVTTIPALALLTLAAAVVPLLQAASGQMVFAGDAALSVLYLLGFALAVVFGQRAVEAVGLGRALESFAWLVLVAALVSLWLALYQWQQLDYLGVFAADLVAGVRPYANFNQPNQLASLMVLGLIAVACLHDAGRLGHATALALLAALGFGCAMAQSRAGYLELAVVSVFLVARFRVFERRLRLPHLLVGIALVWAMAPLWQATSVWAGQPAERGAVAMLEAGPRLTHWSSMAQAILRQPWLGYGWNQTIAAQYAVANDHVATRELLGHAHNLVLDLLVWNGLPIGLLLLTGLGAWFWFALRAARSSSTVLLLAGVLALFAHAMVEYPLYYAYFLIPVGLLMGGISAVCLPRAAVRVPVLAVPLLLALAALGLGLVARDYLGIEADLRSLRFERARIGVNRPPREMSTPLLLTQMGAFVHFARTPEREGMGAAELAAMGDVVERFPSAANMVRYAAALALNERPADAAQVLRRVCRIQSREACTDMQALWTALGERRPALAALPWPND